MTRSFTATSLLVVLLATTTLGLFDAWREGAGDHLVLFAVAAGLAIALVVGQLTGDPAVRLRRDLARWATRRAHLLGQTPEDVTNRAVAGYRALLDDDRELPDPEESHGA